MVSHNCVFTLACYRLVILVFLLSKELEAVGLHACIAQSQQKPSKSFHLVMHAPALAYRLFVTERETYSLTFCRHELIRFHHT